MLGEKIPTLVLEKDYCYNMLCKDFLTEICCNIIWLCNQALCMIMRCIIVITKKTIIAYCRIKSTETSLKMNNGITAHRSVRNFSTPKWIELCCNTIIHLLTQYFSSFGSLLHFKLIFLEYGCTHVTVLLG